MWATVNAPTTETLVNFDIFWPLIWATIFTVLFVFFIYRKVKRADPSKTPGYFVMIGENWVNSFEQIAAASMGGKLKGSYPFFFALFHWLLAITLIELIGFNNPGTNLGVVAVIAIMIIIGVFIIGIVTNGFIKYFKQKWFGHGIDMPLNVMSSILPALSLTLRFFGASFSSAIILVIIPVILSGVGVNPDFLTYIFPFIAMITYQWIFLGIFVLFLGIIHVYIFTSLSMVYWGQEYAEEKITLREENRRKKEAKKIKKEKNIEFKRKEQLEKVEKMERQNKVENTLI